jgi:hypothetical protein
MLRNFSVSWKIAIVSFVFLCMGCAGSADAATSLPAGGSNFETAVAVSGGTYQGQMAVGTDAYYRFDVVPGQEITVTGGFIEDTYSDGDMYFYDGDQQELFSVYGAGGTMGPWLNKSAQRMYLRVANDSFSEDNILAYKVEIASQNRFDAGSQTDAGDTFEKALPLNVGNYTGYVAGVSYMQTPYGDDTKDYYAIPVLKGTNYTFKLTPSTGDEGNLALYSASRTLLDEAYSANGGAVVSLSLSPQLNAAVYLVVGTGYKAGVFDYKLAVESSNTMATYHVCKDTGCEATIGYASLQECQVATSMACYQNASCDGNCPMSGETSFFVCKDTGCEATIGYASLQECQVATSMACYQNASCDGNCPVSGKPPFSCLQDSDCQSGAVCTQYGVCLSINDPTDLDPTDLNAMSWLGMGVMSWFAGWYLLFCVLLYIYIAFCLQTLAKKTNTENGWLAWIPLANIVLMINIAKRPLWWIILILIPIVNIIAGIILWMDIAERRGKEKWIGILLIVPVIGIAVPGYLAFFDYKKKDDVPVADKPYVPTGNKNADKPTVGYKHACKYCDKLIPPDSANCPFCEKVNPLGPSRCPKCHEPVEEKWKTCAKCNQSLRIVCPFCDKVTFFGDHCEDCGARLIVTCPNCKQEQPPIGDKCIKCGELLKGK